MASVSISGWSGAGNRTFTLSVSEISTNPANNSSTVKWTLSVTGGNSQSMDTYVECFISGTSVYNKTISAWNGSSWSGFPANTGSTSGTITIYHNNDGTGSCSYGVRGYALSGQTITSEIKRLTLTNLDRSAPVVRLTSYQATSPSALVFTATSNVPCNKWWYQIDGGAWVVFSQSSTTSVTKNIYSLSSAAHTLYVCGRKTSNQLDGYTSRVTVDLTMPVASLSVADISTTSARITLTSNVSCDRWEYSFDNGTSWTTFSTTQGLSAETTISNLTVNTSYKITARSRNASNGLYSKTEIETFSTLGNSVLNSASPFYPDAEFNLIAFNWSTFVDSYHHKLQILDGESVIITFDDLWTGGTGTWNRNVWISNEQKNTLMNLIPSTQKSYSVTLSLTTYDGYDESSETYGEQIGNASTTTMTLGTTRENSGPIITAYVIDTRPETVAITGNDDVLILGQSTAECAMDITVRNGATIARKTINGETATTKIYRNVTITSFTFSVTDSRGYTVTETINPDVVSYISPTCVASATRVVPVSTNQVTLALTGQFFNDTFGDDGPQNVLTIKYKFKESGAQSFGNETVISSADITASSTAYSLVSGYVIPSLFDYTKIYDLQITVTDSISTAITTIVIAKGTPVFDWGESDFAFNVDVSIKDIDFTISENEYNEIINDLVTKYDERETYFVDDRVINNNITYICVVNTPSPAGHFLLPYWREVT